MKLTVISMGYGTRSGTAGVVTLGFGTKSSRTTTGNNRIGRNRRPLADEEDIREIVEIALKAIGEADDLTIH